MRYAKKNYREFQLRDSHNYFRLFIGSFDNGSLKKNRRQTAAQSVQA